LKQRTLKKKVEGVGVGLHKGEPIHFSLHPLDPNSGIVFYRSDTNTYIEATPENVIDTQMATVIGNAGEHISTIEHLLSATYAYGIDNILIKIDAPEAPVLDGSAASFCMMFNESGIVEQEANKKIMILKKEVEVREGDKYAKISPSANSEFIFSIDFNHPSIGFQKFHLHFSKENYIEQISRARTFGFLKDFQMLRNRNLALGASLDNAVVMDDKKVINSDGLRFSNEFVRHKILDAIGDLALLKMGYLGRYESHAGSHALNHKLTLEILKDPTNYLIRDAEAFNDTTFAKAYA
jgi:UDP-3-O-[3-hydroxymyristoyl] N-acetylglucosamine deacetylase